MNNLWSIVIKPIIERIDAEYIVEIGSDTGINTKNILDYCIENNAHMTAIDPSPRFDIDEFKSKYGDKFEIYTELSLSRLPLLNDYDVIFIDGDHNWYTVYNELKIIEKNFKDKKFPVVFLHDVGWPYGRRDLYYNPENIPEAYRQPYKKLGMYPDNPDLKKTGGLNPELNNAIYENNPQNGVLTAIEDFIHESEIELSLELVNAFYGLGILFPRDKKLEHKIKDVLKNPNILKQVEENRIKFSIALQDKNKEKNFIENKLDSKIELLQAKEFHINSLEEQVKRKSKQAIETNKKLIETKNKLKYSNNKINKLTARILEMHYLKGDNRSLRQKLISKFPSIFILGNFRKTGLKNAILTVKGYRAIKKNKLFNIGYYLKTNPDIIEKGVDPLLHYIYHGYKENRNPNTSFDTYYYMKSYPDVEISRLNPLIHYSLYGIHEFRNTENKCYSP